MGKQYIVTNFAYGTGPYLMTTKLAVAFNDELAKAGHERFGIIVPWIYGEKQKKIMAEEVSDKDLIFDEELGNILRGAFYGNETFEAYLQRWTENFQKISQSANSYLLSNYGKDIVVELNRSPRVLYGVAPAYSTSFSHLSQIFEKSLTAKDISIKTSLLESAKKCTLEIEQKQNLHAIAYPGTFSYRDYQSKYKNEVLVPPLSRVPEKNEDEIESGIYVYLTGIPGLERLYEEARKFGVRVYTNETHSPRIIPNKNILFHFARAGWASVWYSLLSGTPLVIPIFDAKDDPEIYFNNLAIEEMGIAVIYRGQSFEEMLKELEKVKKRSGELRGEILNKFGTMDGIRYSAKLFAEDFLKKP